MTRTLTVTIWREADGYVSLCPELDIASQGDTVEEARANLQEAVDLFFETADAAEVAERLKPEVYVTSMEVNVGEAA
jgi:predicted RNase H-like HicB family nuclease